MVKNYKDIEDIRMAYDNGEYWDDTTIPKKMKENAVIDADLSVNRNRELVAEHNAKVDEIRMKHAQANRDLAKKLTRDVVEYIMGAWNFSEAQANHIEQWCYNEYHSAMCDYFNRIDDICELISGVNELK